MCGILGTVGLPVSVDAFDLARDRLAHRGPDAGATWSDDANGRPIRLGHRRLSILDLSTAANQPFVRDDLVLVFNGEIYNYRDLASELASRGVRFTTTSDTEVVLEGWRAWGAELLPRLRGMFAFALYDRRNHELVLARDRFGIKPLFLWASPQGLAFASEIKAIMALPGFSPKISATGLAATLLYGWIPEEHCAFEGVRKLAPAHWMRVRRDGSTSIHPYWDVTALLEPSPAATVDDVDTALRDAVRAHQIADVEVGVLLSGGLDSSLITALAARDGARPRCYTIGFGAQDRHGEGMSDDLRYARRVASHFRLELHEIEADADVAASLPELMRILDEPFGDAAAFNVLALCRAARASGVPVMLTGMGADEIFGGYRRHLACLVAAHYRTLPSPVRRWVGAGVRRLPVAVAGRGVIATRWAQRFVRFADRDEESAYRQSYSYYEPPMLEAMLGEASHTAVATLCAEHAAHYAAVGSGASAVQRMCFTDLQLFLPGLNLAYTDRASMAASVELRVPFVDSRVVETAFRLPDALRIRGRQQKVAVKKVAERYLPHDVIHRPKANFGLPLRSWTRGALRPQLHELLLRGELVAKGIIAEAPLRGMIQSNDTGAADHAQALWTLLALEHWVRGVSRQTRTG